MPNRVCLNQELSGFGFGFFKTSLLWFAFHESVLAQQNRKRKAFFMFKPFGF